MEHICKSSANFAVQEIIQKNLLIIFYIQQLTMHIFNIAQQNDHMTGLLMLVYPTPTQVNNNFSPPRRKSSLSSGLSWVSILNMIWKKSLIWRRNWVLQKIE